MFSSEPKSYSLDRELDDQFHDSDHISSYLEASKVCTPLGDRYVGFYRHMIRILEALV